MDIPTVFADLEPLLQEEGDEPIVRIAYPPGFETAMNYFRRVLVNGEYSERTLRLSAEIIGHNAANYTAWLFRRRCLTELYGASAADGNRAAWESELAYTTEMVHNNMKNYQVWHHRRAVVDALKDGSQARAPACVLVLRCRICMAISPNAGARLHPHRTQRQWRCQKLPRVVRCRACALAARARSADLSPELAAHRPCKRPPARGSAHVCAGATASGSCARLAAGTRSSHT